MVMSRRDFIKNMLALTASISVSGAFARGLKDEVVKSGSGMPLRELGNTGHQVGIFSLGGEATIERSGRQQEAVEIINRALDLGVNYIDTAPSYGSGDSEKNIGKVMKDRREEVFLASKTHGRSYEETMNLINQSLQRLQTDYLDLYQLQNVRTENDLSQIFAPDGAIKALEELQEEGVIKNLGITGHYNPEVLLTGIKEYDFDCILLSLNAADVHYRPFQEGLLQEAVEQELGIIGMKTLARGRLIRESSEEGLDDVKEALDYVWSLPVSTSIVGISNLQELEENIQLARQFSQLSADEMMELESRTSALQEEGNFFKYNW